jgi:hypothetical protein
MSGSPANRHGNRKANAIMETSERKTGSGGKSEQLGDAAEEMWDRTRDAVDDLKRVTDIQGHVSRHPYGTVAAALGIGYVLGGGIFTPLTSRIVALGLRIGVRMALLPLLQDQISELADAVGVPGESKGRRGGRAAKASSEH